MQCIWCMNFAPEVTFNKAAHIVPQSLGGKRICKEVCDECNHYFGSPKQGLPAIEVVLKEALNISKFFLLWKNIKTEKKKTRFKSIYFNLNTATGFFSTKPKYSLRPGHQRDMARQFKRGIYKIFLEERSLTKGDAHDRKYNFIREFARYNYGDYPVYYYHQRIPAVFFSLEDIESPTLRFSERIEEIIDSFGIYEFSLLGHWFSIATFRGHEITWDLYLKDVAKRDSRIFESIKEIKYLRDIDFTFSRILKE